MNFYTLYVCCLLNLFLSISQAQEVPPVPTTLGFSVVQQTGELGDATVGNLPLYDFNGSVITSDGNLYVTNSFGGFGQPTKTVLQRKTPDGKTFNMHTPVSNPDGTLFSTGITPTISPNGEFIYYWLVRVTGGDQPVFELNRIVDNITTTVPLLDLLGSPYTAAFAKVNNVGTAVLYLTKKDGTKEIATIDRFGFKMTLVSNADLIFPFAFTINGKGTVFFTLRDGSIYEIPKDGALKKVGETNNRLTSHRDSTFVAPEDYSTRPEGIVYYLNQGRIMSSDGLVRVDASSVNTWPDKFSVNSNGTILWSGVDSNNGNRTVLYKGSKIPDDQIIGPFATVEGLDNSGITLPSINDVGDFAFRMFSNDGKSSLIRSAVALCNVSDKGKVIHNTSQAEEAWKADWYANIQPGLDAYGNPSLDANGNPTPGQKMGAYGCGTSVLAMLFDSYGIKKNFDGAEMKPGPLNKAMYSYDVSNDTPRGRGYGIKGAILWTGAAEVARAGYVNQCVSPSKTEAICRKESEEKVSFNENDGFVSYTRPYEIKPDKKRKYFETREHYIERSKTFVPILMKRIEEEICNGNPVVVQMDAPSSPSGMHFVLATAIVLEPNNGNKTLLVQNPGVALTVPGNKDKRISDTDFRSKYPFIAGYRIYKQTRDPAMLFANGSSNIHFILTDPQGNKTGFDPINEISYQNIPNARYDDESYNTPSDEGYAPEILTQEHVFSKLSGVLNGAYHVQIYGTSSGPYTFSMHSFDVNGFSNQDKLFTGDILAGEVKNFDYVHTDLPKPKFNTELDIAKVKFNNFENNKVTPSVVIKGNMLLKKGEEIRLTKPVEIRIGQNSNYVKTIAPSEFKLSKFGKKNEYYIDRGDNEKIIIKVDGGFEINIKDRNLNNVPNDEKQHIYLKVGDHSAYNKVNLKCTRNICVQK